MTKIRRKVGWAGLRVPKQVSKFDIVALAHVMLCLGLRWCKCGFRFRSPFHSFTHARPLWLHDAFPWPAVRAVFAAR